MIDMLSTVDGMKKKVVLCPVKQKEVRLVIDELLIAATAVFVSRASCLFLQV